MEVRGVDCKAGTINIKIILPRFTGLVVFWWPGYVLHTNESQEKSLSDANVNQAWSGIYSELTEILRDVFDSETLVASPELTAPQVDGWDSLGNVRLFLTIEGAFGVRFSAGEMSSIKNVGELAAAIAEKRSR